MRTVVLIGTDHKFQKPIDGPHRAGIESFRNTIRKLCSQHKLTAIAEEMSLAALQADNLEQSVAQQLCIELGQLPHNFSDPAGRERIDLGIRGIGEIKLEGVENGWTNEHVNAEIEESYRIREREWLRRIQMFDMWPLLLICGANHFTHFAKLLQEAEIRVIETFQDWGPIIEVRKSVPLYSDDTYPHRAGPQNYLNQITRTITRHLSPNEKPAVSESVLGMDFWALRIQTDDSSSGWLLDTDEGINISYPA